MLRLSMSSTTRLERFTVFMEQPDMHLVRIAPQNVAIQQREFCDEAIMILLIRKYRRQECGLLGWVPVEVCREIAKFLFSSKEMDPRLMRALERDTSELKRRIERMNELYSRMISFFENNTKNFYEITKMYDLKYYVLYSAPKMKRMNDEISFEEKRDELKKEWKSLQETWDTNLKLMDQSREWGETNLKEMDKAEAKK